VILFNIIIISSVVKLTKSAQRPVARVADNSILHLNLSGFIPEYSAVRNDFGLSFLDELTDSVHDIILKIRAAKDDSRIRAILIEPQFLSVGYANINELIAALNDFKSSGKKIYGYVSVAGQSDMLLLSVCDEVYMNPSASAGIMLHGIGGVIEFYKDMFDKIGMEINIVKAGDYKGGDNFTRRDFSPEARRNLSLVYSDLYEQVVSDFATGYDTTPAAIRDVIERRDMLFINLDAGIEMKLVSELMHFEAMLKKIGTTEKQLVKYSKYTPAEPRSRTNRIAVVYMLGNITSTNNRWSNTNTISSAQYNKIFDNIMKDDNIRGVVLRINSGGGSALESEIIYNKLLQLAEKKPIVVSMGGMAASGGYYIAAPAEYIFADPYTITGSIGVIAMIPNFTELGKKMGITTEKMGHGKFIDFAYPFTTFDRNHERAIQRGIDDTYFEFKSRVATSRGMELSAVEAIAKGQIWSSRRALEHKLIDEIGLLGDAIDKVAEISHAGNYSLTYFPTSRSMFELFMDDYFSIDIVSKFLNSRLPSAMTTPAENVLNILTEIENDPIQMRSEINLDFLR
jgi:protease-4